VVALSRQKKLPKLEELLSKQPTGPVDVEAKMKGLFKAHKAAQESNDA